MIFFKGFLNSIKWSLLFKKERSFGATSFIPVIFKRCVVKISKDDENKKISRWQKIAEVAAKQSGRDKIPLIKNIENLKNICKLFEKYDIVLVAYENENKNSLKEALKSIDSKEKEVRIAVIIGPEGRN